ncbi:hypothetical protein C5S30_03910 [ANME-1 cluster archaeon GoMg4]|nr:hypothetical protein [ANME-1 cluster archaeon GoMg4]
MNAEDRSDLKDFFVEKAVLDGVNIGEDTITFKYLLDGDINTLKVHYKSLSLKEPKLTRDRDALKTFAVSLGVFGFFRFGAVLPAQLDITKYCGWVHPDLVKFLEYTIPHDWSEHRYQIQRLDYKGPEILYNEKELGARMRALPIWKINSTQPEKVMLTSGAGKDSLLCALLLDEAEVRYDVITYLHTYYGGMESQEDLFSTASNVFNSEKQHVVLIYDDYYPWLRERLKRFKVSERIQESSVKKQKFRTEAGEVFFGSMSFIPIQILYDTGLQVLGNEKSADAPNLVDEVTGEEISHQWMKSIYAEKEMFDLFGKMFQGIERVSLLKPFHDVWIFKTLFEKAGDKVYTTYSCNVQKPWCGLCEKCAYVFAGFSAFGNHEKTIKAFGKDLFRDEELIPIWRQLLGLEGYIPWECVGHPEEVQLYFYKAYNSNITGAVIQLFQQEILDRQLKEKGVDVEKYFNEIEEKYSRVYEEHHYMPDRLWKKVHKIVVPIT